MSSKYRTQRNDVASLVLNRNHHHFSSFRRKFISTVICGGACSPTSKPTPKPTIITRPAPEKLIDLLNLSDSSKDDDDEDEEVEETEEVVKKKQGRLDELSAAARKMQSDVAEERRKGAKLIRIMAKEDEEARSILAMMGVIPPLVDMIRVSENPIGEDEETESQIHALYALLNLGIANPLNKAAIVQAGALHKMLDMIRSSNGSLDSSVSEAIVANFLALSALDLNKSIIGASGAIPFLVSVILDKNCSPQAKQDALRALYNLSISPSNISSIIDTNLISYLVVNLGDMEVSERILAILSNVISTSEGRRAVGSVPDAFPTLIDVLNWTDSPECQEKATYVLMVMAHKSYTDRQRMIEARIGPALLEITLLGTTLAQKRASRILECLRAKEVSQRRNTSASTVVSAPIYGSSSTTNINSESEDEMISEEKKAVRQLVQQSLQDNMRRIVKRANLQQDFVPSEHLKALTMGLTSKSLPF